MPTLSKQVALLKEENDGLRRVANSEREARVVAEKALKESREHFADLKQRLQAAESSNQEMRGYIARVQEDDVVREELIATGDPDGEQAMAPKRKPTRFLRPDDFSQPSVADDFSRGYISHRDRPKPKHWITY